MLARVRIANATAKRIVEGTVGRAGHKSGWDEGAQE
jgi:hypothetical protein